MRFAKRRCLAVEQLECRRLLSINPTGQEQEFLQLVNRFRTDPRGEFDRIFSSTSPLKSRYSTIQSDLDRHQVSGALLKSEWAALSPVEPLVWNEALSNFSSSHNNSMIRSNKGFHSDDQARFNAMVAAGLYFQNEGEVVAYRASNAFQIYASYFVNWGTNAATGRSSGGMQYPRSHRSLLMDPVFDQIGTKISATSSSAIGPAVNTAVLIDTYYTPVYVTGAVFHDANKSGWYESGEGYSGSTIEFENASGQKFTTQAFPTGGYQIALKPGTYKVRASGGGLPQAVAQTITVASKSMWVNFIYKVGDPRPDVYEPNDTLATAARLTGRSPSLTGLSLHSNSDVDFFRYVAEGTSMATYSVQFNHANGNIDLELLDATGRVLARSASSTNSESITHQAEAGAVYFLKVLGTANSNYNLQITGPEAIKPDSQESNETLATAKPLSGASPTLSGLSLHTNRDVDHFKYVATGDGSATFRLDFLHSTGNVDLQLLDAAGKVLASSTTTANVETITRSVTRGTTYYIKVFGGQNKSYSLKVTGPVVTAPVAQNHLATATNVNRTVSINLLTGLAGAGESLPDVVVKLAADAPAAFKLGAGGTLTYEAPFNFTGMHRTTYTVTNKHGLTSAPAKVEVFVANLTRTNPWQSPRIFADVNDDGRVSAVDALSIINELNSTRSPNLVKGTSNVAAFVDPSGDNRITALDALLVINHLNQSGNGEGEAIGSSQAPTSLAASPPTPALSDAALAQWTAADYFLDLEERKRL